MVIATHGRAFWVLDNIAPLRQMTAEMLAGTERRAAQLFAPAAAVRRVYSAHLDYYLGAPADSVWLDILGPGGRLVRSLAADGRRPGMHRATWDLRYTGATVFPGIVLEGGDPRRGMWAPPGRYMVRLTARGPTGVVTESCELVVKKDPRLSDVTDADLRAQFALAEQIRDKESAANEAVIQIGALRQQLRTRLGRDTLGMARGMIERIAESGTLLERGIAAVEQEIYQVKNQSPKDKIAFPIRLNDRLTGLRTSLESGDERPTAAQQRIFLELSQELDVQLGRLKRTLGRDLSRLNDALRAAGLAPIVAPGRATVS